MSKAASVPASVGSIVSEDDEIQHAEVRVQWRGGATSEVSDSGAREKSEEERKNGREKPLAMTCGRSIVRPASVSRSETWDGGESGVRKFGVFVPCWPFSETPARRGVHRRGRGDFQRAAGH